MKKCGLFDYFKRLCAVVLHTVGVQVEVLGLGWESEHDTPEVHAYTGLRYVTLRRWSKVPTLC